MLTSVKVIFFSCFAYFFSDFINNWSIVHDLFQTSGLIVAVLFIAWQASWIILGLFKSKIKVPPEGKCILITGCDTGFGHEIAIHLNDVGFTVFAGCLFKDRAAAQSLRSKCKNEGKMHLFSFDVTSGADIQKAYDLIQEHTESSGERLYSVVNNAGISGWAPLEWGTMEHDVEPVIDVDMTAVVRITRTFMPMLRKTSKSRILFMTSYVTHISAPFIAPYVVAKTGVKAFADTLRSEVEVDSQFYNGMKILNIEPTAYKTTLTEYESVKSAVDCTWNRTSGCVKQAYGSQIYEGFRWFISTCQFFQYFDFIVVRSDLKEVALVIEKLIRIEDPSHDNAVMPVYSAAFYYWVHTFTPDEIMELVFQTFAVVGLVFAAEVTFIKKLLTRQS